MVEWMDSSQSVCCTLSCAGVGGRGPVVVGVCVCVVSSAVDSGVVYMVGEKVGGAGGGGGGGVGRCSCNAENGRGIHGMSTGKLMSVKVNVAIMGLWTGRPPSFLTLNPVMKGHACRLARM